MARKTGTSIKMHDHKSTEKTGSCKCLVKQGLDVSLCGDNTLKSEFHYCRDCYSFIRSLYGMKSTKEWPPMRKNHESRYCFDIDEHKTFLINKQWMKKYDAELMSDSAIGFKHPKYRKGGNYPCYVYVFKCKDGMHYIGQTRNLIKNPISRIKVYNSKRSVFFSWTI